MSFNQNNRIRITFTIGEKITIERVLNKFTAYDVANEIAETMKVPGDTVLTAAETLILAGLLWPWYPYISERLVKHPALW